jgi:diguanylate cyclase (GGDEF)-like protein
MEKFGNYVLQEKIHETRNSIIYRGHKENESQPFIVKLLKTKYPSPSEIARFRQEYELIKGLDLDGVIKTFDIISQDDGLALILEDFDGVSIKSLLGNKKKFDLKSFLEISAKIAETLGSLHLKDVIHRDIKPHNILINPKTGVVKITDFGISVILTHENEEVYNPDFITGTLAYMSPEQTGRMNRTVDYRTDLYSFGVTLYEILTGSLPFKSYDPMELIHSHIALMPNSPARLDSVIPEVISDIIMKLLSKNPEERYQNSLGLLADLEECLRQVGSGKSIDKFPLASRDISIKLNIPQIIVGREEESKVLLSAFERSTGEASEMMCVLGPPGIGKSALIYEVQRPIVEKRGYFIFGKYEQFNKDVPYSSIIQAFQGLIKQLLSESDDRISSWKEKLISALGPNGRVITDVIPDMEYIIGKQPDVESLGPEESQNRFNIVFRNFINVFTTADHPVALFLDDLQWADLASLKLIKTIMTGSATKFLFLIGAYRDNEASGHHPLSLMLDKMQKKGRKISSLSLTPLNVVNVNKIIMKVLRCKEEESSKLADLIHKKTGGNPFFVNQFLKNLYDSKVIELDPKTGWIWDMDKIQKMQFTDNVVEFMAGRILSLPEKTREILKVCACIGNRFDLETLSIVLEKTIEEVLADITAAIQEDLVSLYGNIYKFHHDRIQEAAYSLLTPVERERIHFKIGTLDLERTPADQLFKRIFYIVDQLNHGRRLIETPAGRNRLAQLNLQAAIKAKDSTAYKAATRYLSAGLELLADGAWQTDYELTYSLHTEQMECEYLGRNFEEAERLFRIIIAQAKTRIDKAKAYNTMIVLYTTRHLPHEAIALGIEALKLFGVNIPIDIGKDQIARELIKASKRLKKVGLDKVIDLPLTQNKNMLAEHEIILSMGTAAYYVNNNLFAFISLKAVNKVLKYGNTLDSSVAFMAMATIIQTVQGNYEMGYRIGEMALKLNEKIGNKKVMGMIYHIFAFFIQHWKKHIRNDSDLYAKVYESSINAGDFIYAGHSITAAAETRLRISPRLDDVLDELKKYQDFMNTLSDPLIVGQYYQLNQWIMALKGQTPNRDDISSDKSEMSAIIAWLRNERNYYALCFVLSPKVMLLLWYGKYEKALEAAEELDQYIHLVTGTLIVADHYFFYSLILTALLRDGETQRKAKFDALLRRNQRIMHKWATLCPENFQHKYDLVAAEIMAVKGRYREAQTLYHAAIEGARHNEYLQDEALACERLALFYLDGAAKEEARLFMQRAYQCYNSFGAGAKMKVLEEKYAPLVRAEQRYYPMGTMTRTDDTETTAGSSLLDLSTVMQVSQVISSEIMLDRLLQKIMHMSIANAGAQRGYLILESEGELTIEASEDVDNNEVQVMQSMALQECTGLCRAIVNYVYHSGKDVILGNAMQEGPFTSDPYIMRTGCKSIICSPILNKGRLSGILYMENNLTTNTFTPDRLEMLRILSSQVSISIENARLFGLATTDGLTKLYVHRYFHLLLDKEMQRSRRHNKQFSLIMMDIDDFKFFNDTYGHQLGDKVLRIVARTIQKISRVDDVVARYGGEEFVMILPETDAPQAMIAAEKIRAMVESLEIIHGEERLHVKISLGVSAFPIHAAVKEELIRLADAALYTSKRSGKNRVSLSEKKEVH